MTLAPILLAICFSLGHCHDNAYDDDQYSHTSQNKSHTRKGHELEFSIQRANIEEFPSTVLLELRHWLVAEDVQKQSWCGGSIISFKWVVTTASCLECCPGIEERYYTVSGSVRAGSGKISNIGMMQELVEYVIHSEFRYCSKQKASINNIGLVKVEFRFPLGESTIDMARLPEINQALPSGSAATAVGWGFPWLKDTPLDHMMKIKMAVLNQQQCCKELRELWRIDGSQLCTLPVKKDIMIRNVSFGDSGSPVYIEGGLLIGVISWELPGKNYVEITGNTNIAYFRDWIRDIAGI